MDMHYLIFIAILAEICTIHYTIHLVPNSHIDVGWGWTIDQYYRNRVINIYNTINKELESNSNRTFVICEMTYFKWWYFNQTNVIRDKFKKWSGEGRIEFVGGGMIMNDEGLPSFQDIITNYEMGFEFIKSEFNTRPTVGWFLDPFGHSEANTYIMKKLGFKQNVLGRIDYSEKDYRINTTTLEFMWKSFHDDSSSLFTHILAYHYDISGSYLFAFEKHDLNKIKTLKQQWIKEAVNTIYPYLKAFQHNQFLLIFGHDFSYQSPDITYPVLDALTSIKNYTFNNHTFEFIYSTPTNYFNKVNERVKKSEFPIQSHFDLFPLQDRPKHYWSGYFTSRPYLKGSIRLLSNTYLVSSLLMTELLLKQNTYISDNRDTLTKIGIMQHHDTITGTSNEWVSTDYIRIIDEKVKDMHSQMINTLNKLFPTTKVDKICLNNPIVNFGCQDTFNLKQEGNDMMVIDVMNPFIEGEVLISLEFTSSQYEYDAYNDDNEKLNSDFYCITPSQFSYSNKCFMSFFYSFNKEIAITSFQLKANKQKESQPLTALPQTQFLVNKDKGLIKALVFDPFTLSYLISLNKEENNKYNITLQQGFFPGNPNNTCELNINNSDGMYIFSPCSKKPIMFKARFETSYLFKGDISSVIIINFGRGYLIASFYYYPLFIKVDTLINPLLQQEGINYVLVIDSDIRNNVTLHSMNPQPEFWTDSNGMKMMRRVKQFRHMFPYNDQTTTSGNFYPVTESISIREKSNSTYSTEQYSNLSFKDRMITLFNDRPQSGGVTQEGQMILLLSRNSIRDDDRGIGASLYEKQSVTTTFKVQHILMIGRSIYDKDQDGMKVRRFMFNFFRNTPVLFKTSESMSIRSSSTLAQMIHTSSNVIMHFKVDHKDKVIIQFYCMYDYYFNSKEDELFSAKRSIGLVSINLLNKQYKVRLEKLNGKEVKDKPNQLSFHRRLKANDFLVLHLELQPK